MMRAESGIEKPEARTRMPGCGRRWNSSSRFLAACRCFWLLAPGYWLLHSEIVDRIAISVGKQVITESQIDEDVRLTAFLNGEKLNLDLAERKKAAGRLIDQALIRHEMELSRYPMPALSDADKSLAGIRARYQSDNQYRQALETYGLDENALRRRLLWQATFLQFIEFRFRPGIAISDAEVQAYYQQQLAKWRQDGVQPVPSLEDVRGSIEQTLTEQRIDRELEQWLAGARTQVAIRYHDEELR